MTDNSTGRYSIAQTNNFANANYGISHGCHYEAGMATIILTMLSQLPR